jgi:hypothetical protein
MKGKLPMTLGDLRLGAARKCPAGMILRRGHTTKRGTRVEPACVPDKGAPGKTPASGKILPKPEPGGTGGWSKDLPDPQRRGVLRKLSEREGCGTAIKKMTLLRNITTDAETKRKAKADAAWLRRQGFCALKTKKDGKR